MSRARVVSWACMPALLAATGCGLLGVDEEARKSIRDPYVGFVDGPGVEVCFGASRVVSPSKSKTGMPLSVCITKGVEPRACGSASDCRASESCVCGRCVTRPCSSGTDCESQEVCKDSRCTRGCTADDQCNPGEVCSGGGCARPCGSADDCAYGEKCGALDGTCIVKMCSQTVSCAATDECVAQEEIADLREPHLIDFQGTRWAYIELRRRAGKGAVTCAIHRARVTSARRWSVEPMEPVLVAGDEDDGCIGGPSVIEQGETLVMYASRGSGTGIVRAHSADGVVFEREADEVIFPRFDWEGGWVASPGAVVTASGVVVAYEAALGQAIGVATIGSDGQASVRSWLVPSGFEDPVLWREVDRIGAPFLVERNGTLLLYATVHGLDGSDARAGDTVYPADPNDSVGLLATRDLLGWERFPTGPVFGRRTNLRAYLGEKDPAVVIDGTGSWLVYVGSDASGASLTGLGLATTGQ